MVEASGRKNNNNNNNNNIFFFSTLSNCLMMKKDGNISHTHHMLACIKVFKEGGYQEIIQQ